METTDGPILLPGSAITFNANIIEFGTVASSVLGVLIGLLALNLFYKFFLQGYCACKSNQRVDPQVIEVVVNNETDKSTENFIENETKKNEIDEQEKININELIDHISK